MSDEKKKKKKHNALLPYIKVPVIFVLVSLIAVLPMCFIMLSYSVKAVHRAQGVFTPSISDFSLSDSDFIPSDKTDGKVTFERPYALSKFGEISCNGAGLNTSVYYGNNRVSYRGGAGLTAGHALPGEGKAIEVSATPTGGFKALYNVKNGDVITFVTSWGKYKYKVFDISTGNYPKHEGETLYLTTANNKAAFSYLSSDVYVVSAALVSGSEAEEVQNER